jgi:hypothetical protein
MKKLLILAAIGLVLAAFGAVLERIEELACFVSGIGSRLASAREGIQDAVDSADESGFDLEHIDDIRYGIRAEIWENDALPLTGFVEMLSRLALTRRR